MKVFAGLLGVLAGILGTMGGVLNFVVGGVGSAAGSSAAAVTSALGLLAFWVCFGVVLLGIGCFFKPKECGITMLICGIVAFMCNNWISGILAGIAGLIGWFAGRDQPQISS